MQIQFDSSLKNIITNQEQSLNVIKSHSVTDSLEKIQENSTVENSGFFSSIAISFRNFFVSLYAFFKRILSGCYYTSDKSQTTSATTTDPTSETNDVDSRELKEQIEECLTLSAPFTHHNALFYPAVTQSLINSKYDVNATGENGNIPLHTVVKFECAQLLIDAGADVNLENDYHETPLRKLLTDFNPKIITSKTSKRREEFLKIATLLIGQMKSLEPEGSNGRDPLIHIVIEKGLKELLPLMCTKENLKAKNRDGENPIAYVISLLQGGNPSYEKAALHEMILTLLKQGVDLRSVFTHLINYAMFNGLDEIFSQVLINSQFDVKSEQGPKLLKILLTNIKADETIQKAQLRMLDKLIQQGVDLSIGVVEGSLLQYMINKRLHLFAQSLIETGAFDLEEKDPLGRTLLCQVLVSASYPNPKFRSQYLSIAKSLINAGADASVTIESRIIPEYIEMYDSEEWQDFKTFFNKLYGKILRHFSTNYISKE